MTDTVALITAALPIVRERAQLALLIRAALERNDETAACVLMRRYLGMPPKLKVG